jgi:hypothetical protein
VDVTGNLGTIRRRSATPATTDTVTVTFSDGKATVPFNVNIVPPARNSNC